MLCLSCGLRPQAVLLANQLLALSDHGTPFPKGSALGRWVTGFSGPRPQLAAELSSSEMTFPGP